jgi:hypothetical protein
MALCCELSQQSQYIHVKTRSRRKVSPQSFCSPTETDRVERIAATVLNQTNPEIGRRLNP